MLGLGIANKIGLGNLVKKFTKYNRNLSLKRKLVRDRISVQKRNKTKVFVIGFNKTGTTTLESTLHDFGYIVGHQRSGEILFDDVSEKNFETLIDYCNTAEAFQDVPFSLPRMYEVLDHHFPESKFILSVRDSGDQWYNSFIKFQSKIWNDGKLPTREVLSNVSYIYKGYPLRVLDYIYDGVTNEKNHYISVYEKHNQDVRDYFIDNKERLIEVNVANKSDFNRLVDFLDVTTLKTTFSWENKT